MRNVTAVNRGEMVYGGISCCMLIADSVFLSARRAFKFYRTDFDGVALINLHVVVGIHLDQ